MGPKETFNLCALGALSVPEQIFLSFCSLSFQETSKPHSICNLSPSWGTSSRPSRAAETLWHFGVTKIDKNTQKLGSVDEILWRVCSTPSSPRDAAGHAPGVCVLHPLYCSLGVTLRGLGEDSGAHTCLTAATGDILLTGTFLLLQGRQDIFVENVSVPRPES